MTITRIATSQDLTCDEIHAGFDALIKRIAELAAERDCAMQMASQATKDLVRIRSETEAGNAARDFLIESLRIHLGTRNDEIQRLADENKALRARLDQAQQEPKPVRRSWLSGRISNQL